MQPQSFRYLVRFLRFLEAINVEDWLAHKKKGHFLCESGPGVLDRLTSLKLVEIASFVITATLSVIFALVEPVVE